MRQYTKVRARRAVPLFLAGFIILALTGGSCPSNSDSNSSNQGSGEDDTAVASTSPASADTDAFVVTTDFMTGSYSVIHLADRSVQTSIGSINSDATATVLDDKVYVVNRFGQDNIQLINTSDFATAGQFSTGNGSNPQDAALDSATKAYVSRLNDTSLLVMNPETGDTLGTIDLSGHADADGNPEMSGLQIHDGKLYVALQRYDETTFSPTDHGEVLVIDTATNTIEKTITTSATNPYSDFVYSSALDRILVSDVGFFGVNDGGIEAINPTIGASEGLIVSEATLGGDITAFDILSATKGYAIVAVGTDCDNNTGLCNTTVTELVSFNPATGAKLGTVFVGGPFTLVDVRFNSLGQAYLCDTDFTNPGVRVFDGTTDTQLTTSPIDTGLPPYKIVFFNK